MLRYTVFTRGQEQIRGQGLETPSSDSWWTFPYQRRDARLESGPGSLALGVYLHSALEPGWMSIASMTFHGRDARVKVQW